MATASPHAHSHFGRADVQNVGMGVGLLLVVVGILGFIPGITTRYGELMFLGPDSHALFLNLFQVSMLLNLVQLAIGVTGWSMSRSEHGARNFLMGAGVLYILLAIFGLSVGVESTANFLALNTPDNWAHLVLGILMIAAGWLFAERSTRRRR